MMTSQPDPDSYRDTHSSESSYLGSFNEPLQTRLEGRLSLSNSIALLTAGDISDSQRGDFCEIDRESSCYDFDDGSSVSIESTYRDLYKELPVQVIALPPECYPQESKKSSIPVRSKPAKGEWSTPTTQCTSIVSLSSSAAKSLMEISEMGSPTERSNDEQITVPLPFLSESHYQDRLETAPNGKQERVDQGTILANLQREISKTQSRINAIRTRRRDGDSISTDKLQKPIRAGTRISAFSHHSGTHIGSTDTSSSRSREVRGNDDHVFKQQLQANHVCTGVLEPAVIIPDDSPPMNEVLVMVDCKSQNSCNTADLLDEAEDRVEFLANKLEATDDLLEALFKELQDAQDQNMMLELRNAELNRAIETMRDGKTVNTEEFELLMEQCVMLKYAIVVGLLFYVCGQTEIFLSSVVFLWLSLVVVTKDL